MFGSAVRHFLGFNKVGQLAALSLGFGSAGVSRDFIGCHLFGPRMCEAGHWGEVVYIRHPTIFREIRYQHSPLPSWGS